MNTIGLISVLSADMAPYRQIIRYLHICRYEGKVTDIVSADYRPNIGCRYLTDSTIVCTLGRTMVDGEMRPDRAGSEARKGVQF